MSRYFSARDPNEETPEEMLERATLLLAAVKAQDPEVAALGAALREHNIRNHYAERLEESMRRAHR